MKLKSETSISKKRPSETVLLWSQRHVLTENSKTMKSTPTIFWLSKKKKKKKTKQIFYQKIIAKKKGNSLLNE